MWFWNPVDCNEALPGVHDLSQCIEIDDGQHPFKTEATPDGKKWSSDTERHPVLVDIPPPTKEELIAIAEADKETRINHANEQINSHQWPSKLALGRLSDEEKLIFSEWLDYLDAVNAVNTSTAPDIEWPTPPEKSAS
ncbi:TPA: tail fiber assembly protein [Escherichia coli]|uniref:tail fiber assembly protein n=1 Tax=Escherichia coli TaxID=562 RepID=UPI0013304973|nr:tail fiber assembly protein [Escherichia coli]HAO3413506.1 tail fiber assembly protein [Escherichia coli]HBH7510131.1 tail fiber assembly protein [Escherichia coli]HCA7195148.1 tail fiber assembly protein [Escherichia coli]